MNMKNKYTMNIAIFSTEQLISIVSNLLYTMLEANDKINNNRLTYFHSRTIPNISIHTYLSRIHQFAPFDSEALLSMLIYFDRLSKMSDFVIDSYNIHRLLVTSIMVASKYTSDIYFANSRYAKIGGISLRELNQLELELLFMSEFQLYITLEELQAYADQLLTYAMTLLPPPLAVKTIQVCDTIKKPINIQPKPYNHCIKQQKRRNKAQPLLTPPYHPIINKVHPYSRRERNKV